MTQTTLFLRQNLTDSLVGNLLVGDRLLNITSLIRVHSPVHKPWRPFVKESTCLHLSLLGSVKHFLRRCGTLFSNQLDIKCHQFMGLMRHKRNQRGRRVSPDD